MEIDASSCPLPSKAPYQSELSVMQKPYKAQQVPQKEPVKSQVGSGGSSQSPNSDPLYSIKGHKLGRCDAHIEEYPEWGRDNPLIFTGYRVGYSGVWPIFNTLFKVHNETVNIWSHLSLKICFIFILFYIFNNVPRMYHIGIQGQVEFEEAQELDIDKTVGDFTLEKLSEMEQKLNEGTDKFISSYDQTEQLINKDRSSRKENAMNFVKDFTIEIEKAAYLVISNVQNSFHIIWNDQKQNKYDGVSTQYSSDAISIIDNLLISIKAIADFISKYRQLSDDMSAFKDANSRMNVLYRTLDSFKAIYLNFEQKVAIWVSNDPQYEVDPYTFDHSLRLIYVSRWPLIAHASTAIFCLGASAFYHLFQIQSAYVKTVMQRLDFSGICFLIAGSCQPPLMYNFACSEEFKVRNFFIYFICTASFITFIACMTPAMSTPKLRPFRAAMFVILGLSAAIPLVYLGYGADKRYINPEWNATPFLQGGFAYIAGAILYALRIPERWFPNRFDNFGSSHQIFHIGVVAGTVILFNASMDQYLSRKKFICPVNLPPFE